MKTVCIKHYSFFCLSSSIQSSFPVPDSTNFVLIEDLISTTKSEGEKIINLLKLFRANIFRYLCRRALFFIAFIYTVIQHIHIHMFTVYRTELIFFSLLFYSLSILLYFYYSSFLRPILGHL